MKSEFEIQQSEEGDSASFDEDETIQKEQPGNQAAEKQEEKRPLPKLNLQNKEKIADVLKTLEAALFLANRVVSFEELSSVTGVSKAALRTVVEKLQEDYTQKQGAIEIIIAQDGASMQVKPEFLQNVSELSKKPDLSRKSTKILALVAKKGQLLQSELKKYFKGEIYLYTTELKEKGYVDWEKKGNTRLLKPSKKFMETFQTI
ncbi:MAG TPA: SMC-Scp complex subunit ScpB [Candidatus Norongarragalinales archaeon]|nr:SMC-Scp complex subunit ScpB [Candidatus Norongarragalinales archaeon]